MNLLLDTHAFLWFVDGNSQLSLSARRAIEDADNVKRLSMVSVWEMAVKINIGKLKLFEPLPSYVAKHTQQNGIALLSIDLAHVLHVETMPLHHRDPFDRLLIAQTIKESMYLVSVDAILDAYTIERLW